MFRYVALMWNAESAERSAAAGNLEERIKASSSSWGAALCGHGLKVLVADRSRSLGAHHLHGNAGVVVGEIFERQTDIQSDLPAKHAVFGERATKEIASSQGRRLTSGYWGNYVAFLVDTPARVRYVLNDPTGALPCYFTEHRGVKLFFSCLKDCREIGLRFDINWAFVRRRAVNGLIDVETNPLVQVSAVHRGECAKFDSAGGLVSRGFYWHPSSFAGAQDPIDDPDIAARALRSTVRSCVHSLAAHHSSVLQQTSGGLDSSIVFGCLADAPSKPDVTCYTEYVPDSPCDERRWARYVTERRGCRHVELCCDPAAIVFRDMPALGPSVEPACCFSHWQRGPVERHLAAAHRATATFTGEGGDAMLCSTSYVLAVDHSIRRHGLGLRSFRTALLVAARRDRTVWNVLMAAWRRQLVGTSMVEHRRLLSSAAQLVHADALKSVGEQDHFPNPWFSSDIRVPLETIRRLGTLAFPPSFYDLSTTQHSDAPHSVSPLCAQPVFEVCRRIPVDIHFLDGRSRGLARRAFTMEVPAPNLRRQWKDRPLLQPGVMIQRNLDFIREALLDGELTKERILDRGAVELALSNGPTKSRALSSEILNHLDLALWMRQSVH
jgi:asparagine synthase (glutamine-hydrolysing)